MVDSLRLYSRIPPNSINVSTWNKHIIKDGHYFQIFINGVWLAYYPLTNNLIISGKIINLVYNEKSRNLDDIFVDISDLTEFFCSINKVINQYIVNKKFDILKCKVTKMDFCVNIFTNYIEEYITFFNLFFKYNKEGKFSRYKNYVYEEKLNYNTSFYMKTSSEFEKDTRSNFIINFYNKENHLRNKQKKDIEEKGWSSITEKDIEESRNILRLEVQTGYLTLRKICKMHNISWKKRTLLDLIDINITKAVLKYEIERFFTTYDFYSYKEVVKILKEQGYKSKDKIFDYAYKVSRHQKTSSYKRYEKELKNLGIFPYLFIPSKFNINKLSNPINLISAKIEKNRLQGLSLKKRACSPDASPATSSVTEKGGDIYGC